MDGKEVLFIEYNASAQSLKSAWTRLASVNGCITVVLSRRTLTISPHWIVRWLVKLLGMDLCHEIPIANIRGVIEVGRWRSYGKIELHFMSVKEEDRKILLYLKKHSEFIEETKNTIYQ